MVIRVHTRASRARPKLRSQMLPLINIKLRHGQTRIIPLVRAWTLVSSMLQNDGLSRASSNFSRSTCDNWQSPTSLTSCTVYVLLAIIATYMIMYRLLRLFSGVNSQGLRPHRLCFPQTSPLGSSILDNLKTYPETWYLNYFVLQGDYI
jgi:hypothetical protein